MRIATLLIASLSIASIGTAQGATSAADAAKVAEARAARARAGVAPLAGLVGRWSGEATTVQRGGNLRVTQSEDVVWGAAQTVLFIRGTGRALEGPRTGEIVFEAAATVWFDADSNQVRVKTHRDGQVLEVVAEVKPDTLIWGFPVPGGRVRYVIAFGSDRWHEVGHFERPGAAPFKILDMTLARTP
jgi:hypothetical protein